MPTKLNPFLTRLIQQLDLTTFNWTKDAECEEYAGCTFNISSVSLSSAIIKGRTAKITPKKIGQFVTLWTRNTAGITTPYTLADSFDFYIITTQDKDQVGCFIFPKSILGEQGILTTPKQAGKRGFRVYPTWDTPTSKQAQKTKQWQENYFILLSPLNIESLTKAQSILQRR